MSNLESFFHWQKLMEGLSGRALKVLAVVDRLHREGVVPDYALIGSLAALFYTEPVNTNDVDFIFPVGVRIDRTAELYRKLAEYGYSEIDRDGYLLIEGWPVHFLVPFDPLHKKMLATAKEESIDGFTCKVALPEYLAADSVRMSRPEKDFGRIIALRKSPFFKESLFREVLAEFNLKEQWKNLLPKLSSENNWPGPTKRKPGFRSSKSSAF